MERRVVAGGGTQSGQPRLRVNEIFWSLQGEGRFTGTPSAFIRLQGCAVGRPWCDTGYAQRVDEALRLPDESPLVAEKTAAAVKPSEAEEALPEEIILDVRNASEPSEPAVSDAPKKHDRLHR